MSRLMIGADLFCGAGGTSTGLLEAAEMLGVKLRLIAVNHWDLAIATHSRNHPGVRHINSNLENVDPRKMVPGGKLRILVASPECTHHSRARGGKPVNIQNRASPKYILRWIGALDVEDLLVENVPEFAEWGPLHRSGPRAGLPIKKRKGEYFQRFIRKIEAHGYVVQWRILNAADYGDPTTRRRLFIIARKRKAVTFPEPSHGRQAQDLLFGKCNEWRPAREIIDWSVKGESIFSRKGPLSVNTMRRIVAGLQKFGGKAFVIGQQSGARPRGVDQPLPTVAGAGAIAFVEPYIIPYYTERDGQKPRVHSIHEPMPTIPTSNRFALIQPFLVEYYGTGKASSVEEPLKTQTGRDRFGLVQPMILQDAEGKRYVLDILFRMLQPHELAAAMSFPKSYKFSGTREQVVKQIGNAVPVKLAKALCMSLLT